MPALCRPIRRKPPKRFATGTTPHSASSAAYRSRSSTTIRSWRWPASWAMGRGSGRECSASCNPITCLPTGSGVRDKGKVEGMVGWIRRNLLVPVPRATSFTALNEQLLEGCRRRLAKRLRGHDETIGERVARDLAAFQDLPPAPYDACEKKAARVSRWCAIAAPTTRYRPPTAYGHREVVIRGYVHEVMISCGAAMIARHPRSYEREGFVFDPLHYLALLERKTGA